VRWPFWCDACRLDFESVGFKRTLGVYTLPVALYETKCPKCRATCRRRITERNGDEFFWKSAALNAQRRMMAKDLLQPGDPGFDAAYPQHRLRREAEAEANERAEYGRRRSQDNR
jgi:hypothetical protein